MLEKVPKIFSQMVVFHGDESHGAIRKKSPKNKSKNLVVVTIRRSFVNKKNLQRQKTNIEPKNWRFVDVSPFPRGYFQVPYQFIGGVFKL